MVIKINPIDIKIYSEFLHNLEEGHGILESMHVIGIALYEGNYPELVVQDKSGNTFLEVPLNACKGEYGISPYYHENVPSGSFFWFDLELGPAQIYSKFGEHIGSGHHIGGVTWPEANVTLFLIKFGMGIFLWPPHKLQFSSQPSPLPKWRKRRY